jgi:glycine dehydrogenase subunit 1
MCLRVAYRVRYMPYIPHTQEDTTQMLQQLALSQTQELFSEIPPRLRDPSLLNLVTGESEMQVLRQMRQRADQDRYQLSFLGAGSYHHHIPAAVWDLVGRGEFLTAYTPYQAEASQGTLQVIYEYQTMMARLTAMDVANASLYDGASALAEAILMAVRANRQTQAKNILMPDSVHPLYREVCQRLTAAQGIVLHALPFNPSTGQIDAAALAQFMDFDIAAVVVASPNVFGVIEDVHKLTNWAHQQQALMIAVVNPMSLAVLVPPGQWGEKGADIAVGEGQPLGVPVASGGPYFGFMCAQQQWIRQMPGRLVGRTLDLEGKPGFTLTLQAREQHIRRSKATSNICTNQGLLVTAATIYMSLLGPEGLTQVALACHANRQYLLALLEARGFESVFSGAAFHELVVRLPVAVEPVLEHLAQQGILAGVALSPWFSQLPHCLLICTTEVHTAEDLMQLAQQLAQTVAKMVSMSKGTPELVGV